VLVLEAGERPGGGTRSDELTLPGVIHDRCSAVHPLGVASPALRELPLVEHGLTWVHPDLPLAHVLDDGRAGVVRRSLDETAAGLGTDADAYRRTLGPIVEGGLDVVDALLSPLTIPPRPLGALARFGPLGLLPATRLLRRFGTDAGAGVFAGLAAHSTLSLRAPITAGYGLLLGALGHLVGWPVAEGGSQAIADALVSLLRACGGTIETGRVVGSLEELPPARAVLLDLTPRQVLAVAGARLPDRYCKRLARFRYGPGVCKVDWALDGPIPWRAERARRAGTVHVGGSADEVVRSEDEVQRGRHPERPFTLVAQPTVFDPTRAPAGVHTAWAYCHVPHGSTVDMTERIEAQVERFAPGFRDRVLARHTMGPADLERRNANLVGGDISGGAADLRQFLARPVAGLHPWRTPVPGVYLCSASTPPGGGVHGMCGWHAAQEVLRDER
jgi:phytoene dehydrogenase-like protein